MKLALSLFLLGTAVALATRPFDRQLPDQRLFVPNYGDERASRGGAYTDRNRDGIPDVLQQPSFGGRPTQFGQSFPAAMNRQPTFSGVQPGRAPTRGADPYWHFMTEPYEPSQVASDFKVHPSDINFPLPPTSTRTIGNTIPEEYLKQEPEYRHVGPIPNNQHGIPAIIHTNGTGTNVKPQPQ